MTKKLSRPTGRRLQGRPSKVGSDAAVPPPQLDLPLRPRFPLVLPHLAPVKVSEVYETYWRFAAERQAIFFRRVRGETQPWTDDPVLATYKFTNAYRVADRVSQFLIRHVIYREDLPGTPREVFFRILLFKLFNKIETWELLVQAFGPITFEDYRFAHYGRGPEERFKRWAASLFRRLYYATGKPSVWPVCQAPEQLAAP